ncbi:MAG: hypothetical protein J6K29_09810 [Clostridia bacterium]|nr:hypothetical protein [Clostridia bacterium]
MKYQVSDFYFLSSAVGLKARTVEAAYESMCTFIGYPVSMPCLLHAIRGLVAGGFVKVEPDQGHVISATTPLTITPEGQKLAAISPVQKLFGEYKAHQKNEARFCSMERPEVSEDCLTADRVSFDACITRLIRAGDISLPAFDISDAEGGYLKLTVHHPNDGWNGLNDGDRDEDESDPDAAALSYSASVTGTEEQIKAGIRDLIATAHALVTEPPRARKVALHGADRSLLLSLAHASNEQGLVTFRMTVAQIRFNRLRFLGKRDSDLDYAQCGDPIFIHEMTSTEGFAFFDVLANMLARPDLLTEEDFYRLSVIHQKTYNRFTQ